MQGVGFLQGVFSTRNLRMPRQAPQGTSGSAHRSPAATFAFPQADSVAASRVMPSFPRPPRFAEGISVLRGNKVLALYIAALCRRIAEPLKLRCSGGGLLAGSWVFRGRLLSQKPAGVAAGAAGNFRFGTPPACRNFCLPSGGFSCSLARNAVVPSSATFCGRNILPLENPERTGETPHLPARNTFALFVASVEYARGMLHKVGFIFTCGDCGSVRMRCWAFSSENFTRAGGAAHSALFACGLMRIFPAISARKGTDERKVGFSQNIETPQKYMRNFRKLSVPIQTAHGYPCAPVSTGGSF